MKIKFTNDVIKNRMFDVIKLNKTKKTVKIWCYLVPTEISLKNTPYEIFKN